MDIFDVYLVVEIVWKVIQILGFVTVAALIILLPMTVGFFLMFCYEERKEEKARKENPEKYWGDKMKPYKDKIVLYKQIIEMFEEELEKDLKK